MFDILDELFLPNKNRKSIENERLLEIQQKSITDRLKEIEDLTVRKNLLLLNIKNLTKKGEELKVEIAKAEETYSVFMSGELNSLTRDKGKFNKEILQHRDFLIKETEELRARESFLCDFYDYLCVFLEYCFSLMRENNNLIKETEKIRLSLDTEKRVVEKQKMVLSEKQVALDKKLETIDRNLVDTVSNSKFFEKEADKERDFLQKWENKLKVKEIEILGLKETKKRLAKKELSLKNEAKRLQQEALKIKEYRDLVL